MDYTHHREIFNLAWENYNHNRVECQKCHVQKTVQIEEEKDADIYFLHLLYKYSCAQEDNFYDPLSFVKAYGIPNRMIGEAYKMFAEEEGYDEPDLMMENY